MKQKKAVIIGAGIGGLATANILAKAGWSVEVYEQRQSPGGRAGMLETKGFRFDTGPSWYLMPEVFEHYFALLGEDIKDYLQLIKLDPAYKVFFDYRDSVSICSDPARDMIIFEQIESHSGKALLRYLSQAEKTYGLATRYFLYNTFRSYTKLLTAPILRNVPLLISQLLRPIHRYVSSYVKSLPLQQVLEYPMVFLGTSPFQAPAMFHLMSHMDFKQGVYYPMGGIYTIIEAMVGIGEKLGVSYHYNAPVKAINVDGNIASGITLQDGSTIAADIVISDADLHYTETTLLPPTARSYPEKYWSKKQVGPSALLMYLGVSGKLPELEHHNLYFVKEWRQNFEDIYSNQKWPENPSIYVCKPSATDPSVAPKNNENLFILVPLPAGVFLDSKQTEEYAKRYLAIVGSMAGVEKLEERIVYKKIFGPADFVSAFNSWEGTALGMSHILRQSAMFRPSNKSKKIGNLFYAGANAQPGIGLPMCLIGAELIYKHLIGDSTSGPLPHPLETPDA